jgi:hypothetical protein
METPHPIQPRCEVLQPFPGKKFTPDDEERPGAAILLSRAFQWISPRCSILLHGWSKIFLETSAKLSSSNQLIPYDFLLRSVPKQEYQGYNHFVRRVIHQINKVKENSEEYYKSLLMLAI